MMRLLLYLLVVNLIVIAPAKASDDIVIDALVDEMNRTKNELRSGTHPAPFFVSYWVKEVDETELSSCLGSETDVSSARTRTILPTVRLGSYDLDSSVPSRKTTYPIIQLPVDDDYRAIRKAAWLASDQAYTFAIRTFEWKKAFLSQYKIPARLSDLTVEQPVVSIAPKKRLSLDQQRWRATLKQMSTKFKQYPSLQSSKVTLIARSVTNWIVNSEGTKVKDSRLLYAVRIYASTQASDGMPIADYAIAVGTEESDLPSDADLEKLVEKIASRLAEIRNAPLGDDYCGPVLFKGQAAAKFFAQVLAPNFGLAEEIIGNDDWKNPIKHAFGRRILPDYLDVIDDPTARKFENTSLIGGFDFDDEGVPAQKVTIVENGKLKEFCRSRIPTQGAKHSNGHSMVGHGVYNVLQVRSSKTFSEREIKERMDSLAKDAGLDYVLVVETMVDSYRLTECPSVEDKTLTYDTPSYSATAEDPVVAYRLYPDGKKEYVRGLEFNSASLRAFRDIQAVGADAAPYVVEPIDLCSRHLVIPSYLVGELELKAVKPEHSAPPVVPSPLETLGSE